MDILIPTGDFRRSGWLLFYYSFAEGGARDIDEEDLDMVEAWRVLFSNFRDACGGGKLGGELVSGGEWYVLGKFLKGNLLPIAARFMRTSLS